MSLERKLVRQSIECWIRAAGKVLLLHVPATEGHPGFWQPITGGIEGNESILEAAVREVFEETGTRFPDSDFDVVQTNIEVAISPELTINKALFVLDCASFLPLLSEAEHDDYCFLDPAQVEESLFWASNRNTWNLAVGWT